MDDDTNPLFISAVRIFLDYIRDQNGIAAPEKCSLEQLISYLNQFQEEARTKKGEKYSQSTVRVIRYSLNRVISLGRNEQQMRPYPPQTVSVRKKRKTGDMGEMAGHFHHGKRLAANETDFSFVQGVSSRNPDPCGKLRLCRFGPRRQTNERQTMMSGKSGLKVGTAPTVRDNEPMVLSADYVKRLYQNETFSTEDLLALQRKVWFELTIFFRNVLCCPDQRIWTKQTFKVVRGNYGTKHLELNKAFYSTLDWNERRSGDGARIMSSREGSPWCPVVSYELYVSLLDEGCEDFFTTPMYAETKVEPISLVKGTIGYSRKPLSESTHKNMMASIAEVGGLMGDFDNNSVILTGFTTWKLAMSVLERELKGETSKCRCDSFNGLNQNFHTEELQNSRLSVIQAAPRLLADKSCAFNNHSQEPSVWSMESPFQYIVKMEQTEPINTLKASSTKSNGAVWNKKMRLLSFSPQSQDFAVAASGGNDCRPADSEVRSDIPKICAKAERSVHLWSSSNCKIQPDSTVVIGSRGNSGDVENSDVFSEHSCNDSQASIEPDHSVSMIRGRMPVVDGPEELWPRTSFQDDAESISRTSSPCSLLSHTSATNSIIMVRPQVIVINIGESSLKPEKLKRLVTEALDNVSDTADWHDAIQNAIRTASVKAESLLDPTDFPIQIREPSKNRTIALATPPPLTIIEHRDYGSEYGKSEDSASLHGICDNVMNTFRSQRLEEWECSNVHAGQK